MLRQPGPQIFGAVGPDGKADGRNGIVVWKANGVSVENLTACNFLERLPVTPATRSGGTAGTTPG